MTKKELADAKDWLNRVYDPHDMATARDMLREGYELVKRITEGK